MARKKCPSKDKISYIIVLSPNSELTPSYVSKFLHSLDLPITIKETCYGVAIEGKNEDNLKEAIEEVKKQDPGNVYSKRRGFPVADKRRCRAEHGSRPGFNQLQYEYDTLSNIPDALEQFETECEEEEKEKLGVEELKKIFEEEE